MHDKNADVDPLANIENSRAIGELLRERRWTRNYEAAAAKCDAELAKYPADDVARVAFEDALHVATSQFNKHFSKAYEDSGLPPISTPELMHPAAVAALISRNAELEAERKAQMSADDVLSAIEDSAICLENWGELHEARDLRRTAYTLIADCDALAAENKALRDGMWKLADKIAIYADDDEIDSTRLGRLAHFWQGQLNALARTPAAKGNDDG